MNFPRTLPGGRFGRRQTKIKGGPLAGRRLQPDASAVPLHDFLTEGQPDAHAGILGAGVQPLEDTEDSPKVLPIDANAVVANGEAPMLAAALGAHMDAGLQLPAELQAITDEILEKRHQLAGIPLDGREQVLRDDGAVSPQ